MKVLPATKFGVDEKRQFGNLRCPDTAGVVGVSLNRLCHRAARTQDKSTAITIVTSRPLAPYIRRQVENSNTL